MGRVRNMLNKHTPLVSRHHRSRSHREVQCLPFSAHQVPCTPFTGETVRLLLPDALKDSLSTAHACHLFSGRSMQFSSQSLAVCPRAGPRGWGLLPAAPRARDSLGSSKICKNHSVRCALHECARELLMGSCKD